MKTKKSNIFIMAIVLFFSAMLSVHAFDLETFETADVVDLNRKGNILITLLEEKNEIGVKDAEISLYQIANVVIENNNLAFTYTESLNKCKTSLKNLKADNLTEDISKCVTDNILPILSKNTDVKGNVKFEDLDLGLYLVRQTNRVEGYSVIADFLIMIPKVIDNKWNYTIKAEPKTEIYQTIDLKVIKEWNKQNKNNKLPESVTIELLKDSEVIDVITLSNANNWSYIWEDIEKYDNYSVREINVPKGYTVTYKNELYTFTVINTDKLAQTGQIYFPIIILASLGVLFIIIGLVGLKRDNYEK